MLQASPSLWGARGAALANVKIIVQIAVSKFVESPVIQHVTTLVRMRVWIFVQLVVEILAEEPANLAVFIILGLLAYENRRYFKPFLEEWHGKEHNIYRH